MKCKIMPTLAVLHHIHKQNCLINSFFFNLTKILQKTLLNESRRKSKSNPALEFESIMSSNAEFQRNSKNPIKIDSF